MEPGRIGPRGFELLAVEHLLEGFLKIDRLELRHELFSGDAGPVLTRELLRFRPAVAVLPYDARRDRVVLVEQFRPGLVEMEGRPWTIEPVAGLLDPGEDHETAARREAVEEAGATLGRLELVARYVASPGCSTEIVAVYIAEIDAERLPTTAGLASEGEDTRVRIMAADEAFTLIDQTVPTPASTLIALLHLRERRAELRRRWA